MTRHGPIHIFGYLVYKVDSLASRLLRLKENINIWSRNYSLIHKELRNTQDWCFFFAVVIENMRIIPRVGLVAGKQTAEAHWCRLLEHLT